MRRAELESFLEGVPALPEPVPELEQYRTPAPIAAQLLLLARDDGAVVGRHVADLGCGTGMFALGAARLGARHATGVDVSLPSIQLAAQAAQRAGLDALTTFVAGDVASLPRAPEFQAACQRAGPVSTVVMNPPFGAQGANRHADRAFYQVAHAMVSRPPDADPWGGLGADGGTCWSLAMESTEGFLTSLARRMGARIDKVAAWDYPLVQAFAFHRDAARTIRVGAYRFEWR